MNDLERRLGVPMTFVARQNLARFRHMLMTESDPAKRAILEELVEQQERVPRAETAPEGPKPIPE